MSGSIADHLRLLDALDAYEFAEGLTKALPLPQAVDSEDIKYNRLCAVAISCGYEWSSSETTLEWARRRARTFVQSFPNNAAPAVARIADDLTAHRKGIAQ